VTLLKNSQVVASRTMTHQVYGITMEAVMERERYFNQEETGGFTAKITDELGQCVTGLTEAGFSMKLDELPVTPTVTYDEALENYKLQFPLAGLEEGSHQLDVTCQDSRGMIQTSVLTFELINDTAQPLVKVTSPLSNEYGVGIMTNIKVTFNEEIRSGPHLDNITLTDGEDKKICTVNLGEDNITLVPDETLKFDTPYIVIIPAGAITDLAGNENAEYSYQFTTASAPDTVPPAVVRTSPVNNMTGVVNNPLIQITFTETLKEGDAMEGISLQADGMEIPYSIQLVWKTLAITPKVNLPYSTLCTLILPEGAVRDLAENKNEPVQLTFTTGYGADNYRVWRG